MWNRASGKFLESGFIRPSASLDSLQRIDRMHRGLVGICGNDKTLISEICVEVPSGKIHAAKRAASQGAGISIYGMAVGYILASLRFEFPEANITTYTDIEWTGNGKDKTFGSKIKRQFIAKISSAKYDSVADRGMDESDAIALGRFHLGHLKIISLRNRA